MLHDVLYLYRGPSLSILFLCMYVYLSTTEAKGKVQIYVKPKGNKTEDNKLGIQIAEKIYNKKDHKF